MWAVLIVTSFVAFSSSAGAAGGCGDDINGARVACSCGDAVVSDVRLRPGDPVVLGRCKGDGLILRARPGGESLRLDLAGLSLVGEGRGTGIRVLNGGKGGAVIVGGKPGEVAEIAGFTTGIKAHGSERIKEVSRVVLKANKRDGLRVYGSPGAIISDITTTSNGRDGMRVRSHGAQIHSVDARGNAKAGVNVSGENARVQASVADNKGSGILARGRGHDLSGIELGEGQKADVTVRPAK